MLDIPCADTDAIKRLLGEPANRLILEKVRLLANGEDSLAWASLLKLTPGIGTRFFDYVYENGRSSRTTFGEAFLRLLEQRFPGAPRGSSNAATKLGLDTQRWLDAHMYEVTAQDGSWGQWIVNLADGGDLPPPSAEFKELLLALDNLVEPEVNLDRFLGQITPLGKDLALAESSGVRVMTMGGSKGLTVEATIVVGLEDGLVPRPDCDLGEERRLLYVAMTRARWYLYGTWVTRRRGPTARSGTPRVGTVRRYSHFLEGGPVESEDGVGYLEGRWPRKS